MVGVSTAAVCRGPQLQETSRKSMGEKWCYHGRHRAEFEWVVKQPIIDWDDEATVYAAMWGGYSYAECSRCKAHDSQLFPGWTYVEVDE